MVVAISIIIFFFCLQSLLQKVSKRKCLLIESIGFESGFPIFLHLTCLKLNFNRKLQSYCEYQAAFQCILVTYKSSIFDIHIFVWSILCSSLHFYYPSCTYLLCLFLLFFSYILSSTFICSLCLCFLTISLYFSLNFTYQKCYICHSQVDLLCLI